MNRNEARAYFAHILLKKCPSCYAPVGEMCLNNNRVWVHLERVQLFNLKEAPTKFPLDVESPFMRAAKSIADAFSKVGRQLENNRRRSPFVRDQIAQKEQASQITYEHNIQLERLRGYSFVVKYARETQAALEAGHVPLWEQL